MARKTKVRLPGGKVVDATVDPREVDLEAEDIRDSKGNRIDDAYVAEVVAHSQARHGAGRPSLTGPGQHSPTLQVRVTPQLRRALEAKAAAEGKRLSDVTREALERYVS